MWMEGLRFAIPAYIMAFGTILIGGVFAILAWLRIAFYRGGEVPEKLPPALYTIISAVGIEILGIIVLGKIPFELTERQVLGISIPSCVWSIFLLSGLALVVTSLALCRGHRGRGWGILRLGASCLVLVHLFGGFCFVMALPGMPWH
jgi:hypothetical protein